ncbi:hypothetical protein ACFLSJ_08050, partial [Verrucomicrobiota bacterium]
LAQRDEQIAELKKQAAAAEEAREGRRWRRQDRAQYMERLKEEDPARYEEIQKQRAEFRERLEVNAGDQYTFLSAVDVSGWPEELQDNHAKVLETVAVVYDAISRASTNGVGEASDVRRRMFRQLRDSREMFAAEREMLLYDAAQQMGFDDGESRQFVEYIQTVDNATSARGLFRRSGPPRENAPR